MKLIRSAGVILLLAGAGLSLHSVAWAAPAREAVVSPATPTTPTTTATTTVATSGPSILEALNQPKQDLTQPEEDMERDEIFLLFEKRRVDTPNALNFLAYWVQKATALGTPANTIVLILLIPVLATLISFVRVIVGLPSLEMLVPIVLAFALVAVGISTGLMLLAAVVLASFASRALLRNVRIMYFPKRAISHLLLAFFVFAALTIGVIINPDSIRQLSIFPVLIITLLGDSIVSVQLHKTVRETLIITSVTLVLGIVGFLLATSTAVRDLILLYPEVVLLTLPINLAIGRYFGLRVTELVRFRSLR